MNRLRSAAVAAAALPLALGALSGCSDLDSVLGDASLDSPERIASFEDFLAGDFVAEFAELKEPGTRYECVEGEDEWVSVSPHPKKVAIRMTLGSGSCPVMEGEDDEVSYLIRAKQKPRGAFEATLEFGPETFEVLEPKVAEAFRAVVTAQAKAAAQ